jgi:ubiquinone/menaquinone biosynthesis C-methylase UbiE
MADPTSELLAAGYDAVYAAIRTSPTLRRIWRQHALGDDYPEGFEPISFLSRAELDRVAASLQLQRGQTLVDLGCGLAGPSLWLARESGASLVGVDLSAVAIAAAAARAADLGLAGQARFVTGSFAQTNLAASAAHACMSIDALQYAPDKQAAFTEAARILRPGGRLVFTAFELDRERAAGLPIIGLDPVDDYAPLLRSAGFSPLVYEETPDWWQRVRSTYEAIMAAASLLTDELGQLAWQSLSSEVSLTLERKFYRSHVFVVATRE